MFWVVARDVARATAASGVMVRLQSGCSKIGSCRLGVGVLFADVAFEQSARFEDFDIRRCYG